MKTTFEACNQKYDYTIFYSMYTVDIVLKNQYGLLIPKYIFSVC